MEEGSLRVDANVSARPPARPKLGTKTEVKNMNSFSGVERALEVEFARQCAVLDAGERVEQQTMLWDADTASVRPARTKEGSHDYRYFPEPDLPPLVLALASGSSRSRRELPELPAARRARYRDEYRARRRTTSTCSPRAARSPTTSRRWRARTATPRPPRTG